MISSTISRKGAARMNSFTRVNEFIYFVMLGDYVLEPLDDADYYQSMVKNLNVTEVYQLYRDYLDHFRVNRGRN